MAKKTILFADNDPDFLETRKEFLERQGYEVISATSPVQARQILEHRHVDLAILDIRLAYDDDERDVSGLTLAKDPRFHPVPKIILTGFPSYQYVREVLGPALDSLPPAVDFLAKQEGPEVMIQAVEQAFEEYVGVNYELTIAFSELQSFQGWARQIASRDLSEDESNERAQEIEKLIRRLFYDYTDIALDGIPTGRPAEVRAWARAKSRPTEGPRLIKCATREVMRAEKVAFGMWGDLLPGSPLFKELVWNESVHFGAVAYSPIRTESEPIQWLAEYFQWHRTGEIVRVLEKFADKVRPSLYAQPCPPNEDKSLNSLYREQTGLTPECVSEESFRQALQEVIEHMRVRHLVVVEPKSGSQTVVFHLSDGSEVIGQDPTFYIYQNAMRFDPPVLCRLTLGNMDGYNILVDRQGDVSITDFAAIGPAPALSDFIALEAKIRFEWIETTDLNHLRDLEACLATIGPLEEPPVREDVEPADLKKAIQVISRLRQLAADVPGADLWEYHFGILFHAASLIVADVSPDCKAHALLSAAMICQGLSTWQA